jgi:hypothetical protein
LIVYLVFVLSKAVRVIACAAKTPSIDSTASMSTVASN